MTDKLDLDALEALYKRAMSPPLSTEDGRKAESALWRAAPALIAKAREVERLIAELDEVRARAKSLATILAKCRDRAALHGDTGDVDGEWR